MEKSKDIIKLFISCILFFFIGIIFSLVLESIFNVDVRSLGIKELALIQFILTLVLALVFSIIYFDILKYSFKRIKELKIKQIISGVVIGLMMIYVVRIAAGIIESIIAAVAGINLDAVDNQVAIETMLKSAPIITIISGCLLGPIEEELLFRGAVGKVLKNKRVFLAVSALIFGLMHVTDSILLIGEIFLIGYVIQTIFERNESKQRCLLLSVISTVLILLLFSGLYYLEFGNLITVIKNLDLNEVIGGISYILTGLVLAYLYEQNNRDLCTNILIHISVNTIGIIMALCLL